MNRSGNWSIPIILLVIIFSTILLLPEDECDCLKTAIHADDPQNFFDIKQRRISGLDIGGKFKGLLEYIPPAAQANPDQKFPLILFFHGYGAAGDGSAEALCRLLYDGTNFAGTTLPGRIEKENSTTDGIPKGPQEFIVLSPQLAVYSFPKNFPDADDVQELVDYILLTYPQIDHKRIYLTGISSGANIVIEYISSSVVRAEKIAAASIASLCSYIDTDRNRSEGLFAENIAKAQLPVWFIQSENDDKGCPPEIPMQWIERIKQHGGREPRLTLLHNRKDGDPGLTATRLKHNTWFRLYDPQLSEQPNQYEWFLQFSR